MPYGGSVTKLSTEPSGRAFSQWTASPLSHSQAAAFPSVTNARAAPAVS